MSRKSGVKVAVAIITDDQQRILITQRPSHVPHGGCWEFPGGKLEANELAEDALIREIREEIGIEIHQCLFLGDFSYQYPDKLVQLLVFHVTRFSGTPSCLEGQPNMKWIEKVNLNPEDFPAANRGIFEFIAISEPL